MCNGADWKVAPKVDLQCRLGVEVFGFKADSLYRALSVQRVCLSHKVWLWGGNCLGTTKLWGATEALNDLLCSLTMALQQSNYVWLLRQQQTGMHMWGNTLFTAKCFFQHTVPWGILTRTSKSLSALATKMTMHRGA